ncbi:MAG: hypothetical protein ABIO55_00370 [Ginsengibacter sp.]
MTPKKYKRFENVIDQYINLLDEQIELPIHIQKANDKFNQHLTDAGAEIYKPKEAEDIFKNFMQIKKYEERKTEIRDELIEVENIMKEFLSAIKGGKITYEKKDDNDKSKITFLFWLEDGKIMSNR